MVLEIYCFVVGVENIFYVIESGQVLWLVFCCKKFGVESLWDLIFM